MAKTADNTPLPTLADVRAAAGRVAPYVRKTPVLRSDALDNIAGANLFCKAECLQVTGSFKIRGATHCIMRIKEQFGDVEIVAFSSGNHAQGVSRAAKWFGLRATIVIPETAPQVKIEGVTADGATIRFYDPKTESREEIAKQIASDTGAVLVSSYDDEDIVTGQGSCGVELGEQISASGSDLKALICCAGGGGLVAGISLAFAETNTEVWTAEPEGHDDWARSLVAGNRVSNAPGVRSICDAILTPQPGQIAWNVGRDRFAGGLSVSDEQALKAMKLAFRHLKVVLEPGGAVALASALFALPEELKGSRVGVILSGGNVDADMFARALAVNYP